MVLTTKITNKLKDLPSKSGVYIFKNADGQIIYVGKAVQLANRVRSYFHASAKGTKVMAMVDNVADLEYYITLTEKDALSLEANLIKKHKPRYNILLKDDKHAPYIRINLKEDYPRLEVVRRVKNDGAKYFGPYFFGVRVQDILDIVRTAYQVRTNCNSFKSVKRACLNSDIGLCLAPCQGKISKNEYAQKLDLVMEFLSGKDNLPEKIITAKMNLAAEREEFERAIECRDRLVMLKTLKERVLTELQNEGKNMDAIALVGEGYFASISIVIVRSGKLMGVKNFSSSGVLDPLQGLSQFIGQYYSETSGDIPPRILLSDAIETEALGEYLTALCGKKVELGVPQKGIKKKLVLMASENAKDNLTKGMEKNERDYQMHEGANVRLGEMLGITNLHRIECYDISHISGTHKVASGVCFIDGRMAKKEYRRYKIKTVEGVDDFASLAEVLERRLKRGIGEAKASYDEADTVFASLSYELKGGLDGEGEKFSELPDLIVIDGGKGQLSATHKVMVDSGLNIPMIALAERIEEIFTVGNSEPIVLPKDSFILKLLQRIRDEAHRFAVNYHRTLRSKKDESILDKIKGIGAKKRVQLLKAFSYSIERIKNASQQDLVSLGGIDKRAAVAVVEFFSKDKNEI